MDSIDRTPITNSQSTFKVLSRKLAESYVSDRKYIMVSITDPDRPEAELLDDPNRVDTLRLTYWDIDNLEHPWADKCYSYDQAKQTAEFLKKYKNTGVEFVAHCEGGICRSSGTLAAFTKYLGLTDKVFFERYRPNKLVYNRLLEKLQEEDSG